jgi:hypothetical protein
MTTKEKDTQRVALHFMVDAKVLERLRVQAARRTMAQPHNPVTVNDVARHLILLGLESAEMSDPRQRELVTPPSAALAPKKRNAR